jgi:hypothetical protein
LKKAVNILINGFLFILVFLTISPFSQASSLENIPIDSWVYPIIDELYLQGFFPKLHRNMKPFQRKEIASHLIELDEKIKSKELDLTPPQIWLLDKLKEEFFWEMKRLKEKKKGRILKFGIDPHLYLIQNRIDTSWTKGKLELDFAFQLKDRFLLKDRIIVDTKAEKDPNLYGRKWENDLTGVFDQGYLKLNLKSFGLLFGRDYLRWGPGQKDFLLLSGFSPPFDMLKLEAELGKFKFLFFAAVLDEQIVADTLYKRYLSGHRINFKPTPHLELGASEVVLYGGPDRSWELYYLNPILLYYGEQFNQKKDDNPLWGFDFSFTRIKDLEIYGEFLIDDFQYDFKTEPHQIGFRLGTNYANFFNLEGSFLSLEYLRINKWVYGQNKPWNLYTYHDVGLGSALGPDADLLSISFLYHLNSDLQLNSSFSYKRNGKGRIAVQPGKVPKPEKFPSGVVEYTKSLYFFLLFQPDANLQVQGGVGFNKVDNSSNQENRDEDNFYLKLRLNYNFWREWWF